MENQENIMDTLLSENMQKIKKKIVVMSGKGGVGKSTVSVNIAYGLALEGNKVGLLDVDLHGPSIAKMTGIEGKMIYAAENERPKPIEAAHNLFVLSVASLLENADEPIIWRGPAKIGVIKQFLSEIEWPSLDYLVVDCPPGTGDEPLSVIQLLNNISGVVIVTTPQDVALLDVRKSINFAKKLEVNILGIVENMAGFVCPHCDKKVDIFKSGGAEKASKDFNIDVLGSIPIDTNIVHSGDEGKPYIYHYGKTEGGKIFINIAEKIIEKLGNL
ncbi:MAG: ATP-binding protein [Spirochaetes bacterium GWC1_27_15]|nr:MAG: ATP-binding protein [Spirochaetes bacterium GWB1_27_13]OHD27528.1 MAG: ATP-binding protein [Spirochaetes bacterium GWC1_27_15]